MEVGSLLAPTGSFDAAGSLFAPSDLFEEPLCHKVKGRKVQPAGYISGLSIVSQSLEGTATFQDLVRKC